MSAVEELYGVVSDLASGAGGIVTAYIDHLGRASYVATPLSETPPAVILGQQAEMLGNHLEQTRPVTWILAPSKAQGTLWAGRNLPALHKRRVVATANQLAGVILNPFDRVVVLNRPRVDENLLLELDLSLARASLGHAEVVREVRE
ncbi:hypothetical protein [Cellulosimicrobium sp. TH-20]|uniref:hypothetical protein n=1 Tax=Cellulosimicrobium sp. TH-20 TaxID=1980001 RepID=UPI0011AA2A0A|nr:hypothetical protein [Cellulosimicrobium sp. TH-20]